MFVANLKEELVGDSNQILAIMKKGEGEFTDAWHCLMLLTNNFDLLSGGWAIIKASYVG